MVLRWSSVSVVLFVRRHVVNLEAHTTQHTNTSIHQTHCRSAFQMSTHQSNSSPSNALECLRPIIPLDIVKHRPFFSLTPLSWLVSEPFSARGSPGEQLRQFRIDGWNSSGENVVMLLLLLLLLPLLSLMIMLMTMRTTTKDTRSLYAVLRCSPRSWPVFAFRSKLFVHAYPACYMHLTVATEVCLAKHVSTMKRIMSVDQRVSSVERFIVTWSSRIVTFFLMSEIITVHISSSPSHRVVYFVRVQALFLSTIGCVWRYVCGWRGADFERHLIPDSADVEQRKEWETKLIQDLKRSIYNSVKSASVTHLSTHTSNCVLTGVHPYNYVWIYMYNWIN